MSASNYHLVTSAVFGNVYIAKLSKRSPKTITDDRREVPQSELIPAIVQWAEGQVQDGYVLELAKQPKNPGERRVLASIILHDKMPLGELILATTSMGANLAVKERNEQIEKHGFSLDHDKQNNEGELLGAALFCLDPVKFSEHYPCWWDKEVKQGEKPYRLRLIDTPPKDRLLKAAALLMAEYDRLTEEEKLSYAQGS